MNQLTPLQQDILLECSEDDVGLWEIIRFVESAFPTASDQEVKEEALSALLPLLKAGLIDAGLPAAGYPTHVYEWSNLPSYVIESWNLPPEQVIERIRREWDQLGQTPTLGDIVWFVSTIEGDRMLAEGKPRVTLESHEGEDRS